jgi:hypothetical protein
MGTDEMSYTSEILKGFNQSRFDLDFNREAEDTGNVCGWVPDSDDDLAAATPFEAVEDLIPKNQWKDRIAEIDADPDGWLERMIVMILNQKSEPSCTHNASAQGQMITQGRMFGTHNVVPLSPMSSYRWNGSRFSGSSVSGALNWLREVGQLPARTPENLALVEKGLFRHTHPFTGYGEPFMDNWKDTAKIFRVDEFLKLTSVEAWVTAQLKGYVCIGGRSGHCIVFVRPAWDGDIMSIYCNSWGPWNDEMQIATGMAKGFGVDGRGSIATMTSRGAWAIRSVVIPPWIAA